MALIHVVVIEDFRSSFGGRLGLFRLDLGPVWGPSGHKPARNRAPRGPHETQKTIGNVQLQPHGLQPHLWTSDVVHKRYSTDHIHRLDRIAGGYEGLEQLSYVTQ